MGVDGGIQFLSATRRGAATIVATEAVASVKNVNLANIKMA